MKKTFLMTLIALLGMSMNAKQQDVLQLLVGTSTDNCDSKGIYLYQFNQDTGESTLKETTLVSNPTFLTVPQPTGYIYSVVESGPGKAAATSIRFADNHFGDKTTCLASPEEKGAEHPCNVWTDTKFVVTANYTGGSLSVFSIDGGDLKLYQFIPFGKLQENSVSHLHCALPTPDGKYLLVTDLGNDCIYRFTINYKAKDGEPYLTDRRIIYNGPKGWGPRHFTFSEDGQFMYLINELGGTLVAFRYVGGHLLPIQDLMAEEVPAHGSADIHLSPDGHYLYASHRLKNDGVSIYKVNKANGYVKKVGYQKTAQHPRNFAITPNGKYVLVACRDGNCIEIFQRNKHTGLLTKIDSKTINMPKPMCVLFF